MYYYERLTFYQKTLYFVWPLMAARWSRILEEMTTYSRNFWAIRWTSALLPAVLSLTHSRSPCPMPHACMYVWMTDHDFFLSFFLKGPFPFFSYFLLGAAYASAADWLGADSIGKNPLRFKFDFVTCLNYLFLEISQYWETDWLFHWTRCIYWWISQTPTYMQEITCARFCDSRPGSLVIHAT